MPTDDAREDAAPAAAPVAGGFRPDGLRLALEPATQERRYELRGTLGVGTTGTVVRVHDRDLGREVAMKFADATTGDRAALLHEARVAARLEHPNVPPVYDAGMTTGGELWFAMKRIDGMSLATAIELAVDGSPPPAIADAHRRVGVILQVGNAVGAAHAQGLLHRDIKPSNIMLGGFGEVLLVDWGSATPTADQPEAGTVGTPWYMSPAQARGEPSTTACDVYALGATLFHLLCLRPPLDAGDDATFWRRKRAGEIDPPTAGERATVPRHLLAIALKALAPDATRRYATVADLTADLARWQSGQPISACADTWRERARRIARRHGRRIAAAAVVVAAIAGLGLALYGEKLKELATWGRPTVTESFADDGWSDRWVTLEGGWKRDGARIVSTGSTASLLCWPKRLSGPCAIEYVGEMLSDSKPCDLSLIWSRGLDRATWGWGALTSMLNLQVGAIDADHTAITCNWKQFAYHPFRPVPGRRYRIRVEVVDDTITLAVDGAVLCRYRDPLPLEGGYFTFYAYYPGKTFTDVRVYELGVPQRLPATATGDAFAARGEWAVAAEEYDRVARCHPATPLGRLARYKQGLSLHRAHRDSEAEAAWDGLDDPRLAGFARVHRAELRFQAGDDAAAMDDLEPLVASGDEEVRVRAAALWAGTAQDRQYRDPPEPDPVISRFVAARDRWFADLRFTELAVIDSLTALRRNDEIIRRFPGNRSAVAGALLRLSRCDEVLRDYADQRMIASMALDHMGRWDEERAGYPEFYIGETDAWFTAPDRVDAHAGRGDWPIGGLAALQLGRPDEARRRWPGNAIVEGLCRLQAGERPGPEEFGDPWLRFCALMARGDAAAAAGIPGIHDRDRRDAAGRIALATWIAGDRAGAARILGDTQVRVHPCDQGFTEHLLPILLDGFAGGDWRAAAARLAEQRPWMDHQRLRHDCALLLAREGDAAFLAQPNRLFIDAELALLRAVAADLAGDRRAAGDGYRRYLALPAWRIALAPGTVREDLARWRLAAVSTPEPTDPTR